MKLILSALLLLSILCVGPGSVAQGVNSLELKKALPEVFQVLGPKKFFGMIGLFNDLENRRLDVVNYCQGRLTLTSGTPVTTADVSNATTVYFTPFGGNYISLYNGTTWQIFPFKEISVSVPATTSTPFDIFGYSNAGGLTLETVNWTNDTTRATDVVKQNGIYVKSGDATHRYLGTGRTDADTGETHDSVDHRYLWNNCNRFPRKLWFAFGNNSIWAYQSSTWQPPNGGTTEPYFLHVVVGLPESLLDLYITTISSTDSTADSAEISIGQDTTNTPHSESIGRFVQSGIISQTEGRSTLRINPSVGYHSYGWLERTNDANAAWIVAGTHTNCSGTGTQCATWTLHGSIDG